MKKKIFGRKLSRSRPAREALFSALVRSMILSGKMVTTRAKAKAVQGDLEHMVTLAKKGDFNSRQKALSYLDNAKEIVHLLFNDVASAFGNKTSGFIRIINLPTRKGDNAKMVRVEWTEKVELKPKAKVEKAKKETKATKKEAKKVVKPAKAVKADKKK
jgi:large subunit ribosomal protein L17